MNSIVNHRWLALWVGLSIVSTACSADPEDRTESDRANEVGTADAEIFTDPIYNTDLSLALPLLMDARSSQGPLPGAGWYTTSVIQNLADSATTVRLVVKTTDGVEHPSVPQVLAPHQSVVFRPDNPGALGTFGIPAIANGFKGAGIIEADKPVAAVVMLSNVQVNVMGTPGGTATATYIALPMKSWGFETGKGLLYPTMKNGFNGRSTTIFVQNLETYAGLAKLKVRTNEGKVYTTSVDVGGRQSIAISPSAFKDSNNNGMPAACTGTANDANTGGKCFGAVMVEADPLGASPRFAAVAVELPADASAPGPAVSASHFHKSVALTNYHFGRWCPVIKNDYPSGQNIKSGIAITNVSGSPANITVILNGRASPPNPASQQTYSYTFTGVLPFRSVVASPYPGNEATLGGFPAGGIGTATISSTGPVIAEVNEGVGSGGSTLESGYQCASFQDNIAAPLIKFAFPSASDPSAASTEVTIMNVGQQAASITGTYTCRAAGSNSFTTHTMVKTAGAGATADFSPAAIHNLATPPLPTGRLCSATFTTLQRTLIGTITEASAGRDPATYEGILFD